LGSKKHKAKPNKKTAIQVKKYSEDHEKHKELCRLDGFEKKEEKKKQELGRNHWQTRNCREEADISYSIIILWR